MPHHGEHDGDPHEIWYRFANRQLGYTGNNGTRETDYAASIANRTGTPGSGAFFNGSTTSVAQGDFDQSLNPINSYDQGSTGGLYTVREGDTLAGLAERLWGDASLWWKIAEANGLTGQAALVEGQALTLPAGVQRATHNAQTFQPYDPSETIGDTAPTTLQPTPKKNKCGVIGRIFIAIIAFAVEQLLNKVIPGVGGVVGKAIRSIAIKAGAAAASQAVAVATGIQDKFSWNAVGLAALSAGVNASPIGHVTSSGVANAMIASAATQGLGVATGLQAKFDWAAVAAAGVGSYVGAKVGDALPKSVAPMAASTIVSTAQLLANAGTRSLIDGSDFGDNILAALPDVIGQTIGGAFAASKGGSNWESQFKGIEAQGDADESMPYGALTKQPLKSNESAYGPLRVDITRGYVDEIVVTGVRKNPAFISNWSWTSDWMRRIDSASRRYAATARPTLPMPPSIGQQLYQTVVGNVLDQYNARQQMAFAMFAAADANSRQNAQLAAGFDITFNNLETLGLLAGAAINYVGSPILAPIDAYVGRPIHTWSGGAFSVELAGDAAVTIGGMLVAPSAGAGRSMAVRGAAIVDDVALPGQVLYHYTDEAGLAGILADDALNPSLRALNPKDVRFGNGQYLSDIVPGTMTPNKLSRTFLGLPFQGRRFTHYVAIDTTSLGAVQGRAGVFVIPNETPLSLTGLIVNSGKVPGP